ncbi:hypothetical protein MNEG_9828 [Monoraphidium neglectum]|uniref:UspA domain-containing protein n=1 Tax=Monoraphidium neglectum TaxID=145388 RepID=A0A0D2M3J9_9CHLO|nr:hypothetical protein MNEG_9828 [Monoraphidium neglectum]KIY98134.1 hypothetical protein MNEG_9828 [Monoraphidium neglectum]|eukprot:XP_013897154.1 hypothetical protein MNEG_9828 [Monoraphidium neglectum]
MCPRAALLAASLYKTIPGVTQLVKCIQNAADPNKIMAQAAAMAGANADPQQIVTAAQQGPSVCLRAFWDGYQITFVLSIVGVACLLVALLTCCCFCCAERPRDKELLHVLPPAAAMASGLTAHAASFDADAGDEGGAAALAERTREGIERAFVRKCVAAGATVEVELISQRSCNQDVSGAIVSRVEELQAAVVVMPEQPQSFLESLFQTPVAQQVAARCRRPTVLIR